MVYMINLNFNMAAIPVIKKCKSGISALGYFILYIIQLFTEWALQSH